MEYNRINVTEVSMTIKEIEQLLIKKKLECVYSHKRYKSYENKQLYVVLDRLRNNLVIHTLDSRGMINPMNSGHLNFQEAYEEILQL